MIIFPVTLVLFTSAMIFCHSSVYMHAGQQLSLRHGVRSELGDTFPNFIRVRRATSHVVNANDANLGLRVCSLIPAIATTAVSSPCSDCLFALPERPLLCFLELSHDHKYGTHVRTAAAGNLVDAFRVYLRHT